MAQAALAEQTSAYLRAAESFGWEERLDPTGTSGPLLCREPVGVVAAMIPWNAPYQSALAKMVPAHHASATFDSPASCNAGRASRDEFGVVALRCLIVDDNAHFLAAARGLLAREGMVVDVASSSAEALAMAEEFQPDVLLVDIELGQDCGLDLARQLAAAPGAQHSSVILCWAPALPAAAQCLTQTLELPSAVIELDTVAGDEHRTALPLRGGATRLGTLLVPADLAEPMQRRLRERIAPSLEALLRSALERQAIGRALETSRDEQRLLAEQQAALRRVATLVARSVFPAQIFKAVAEQMGTILHTESTEVIRFGADGLCTLAGSWTRGKPRRSRPVSCCPAEPGTVVELVLRTGRPARISFDRDRYGDGVISRWVREQGIASAVGCPIVVEGRQWGAMLAFSTGGELQPADTEDRMLEFTELLATAIANTESRDGLRLLAEQQAALRRVATLVARGVCPTQLFRAVAEQMGQILGAEFIEIVRYETDRAYAVVGSWTRCKPTLSRRLGSRWPIKPGIVPEVLLRTGCPARIDFYRNGYSDGEVSTWLHQNGINSAVGCPIMVEGRQWGAMIAFSTKAEPPPVDTEERMQEFTGLVATAIANAESRSELIASRARVVAAADATRRRIERNLHDGTQQRLVSLALELSAAQAATPPELSELRARLSHTARGLAEATKELQEISRGIHPAILSSGGIAPALKTLARRSAIPVELTVNANQRLAEPVEVAAYYIVSEALTNTAKHARASVVHVSLDVEDAIVRLWIRDDGDGGADPDQGSGLTGLRDRVEALDGTIEISSPTGVGTSLTVTIPIHNELRAAHQPTGSRHLVPVQNSMQVSIGPSRYRPRDRRRARKTDAVKGSASWPSGPRATSH